MTSHATRVTMDLEGLNGAVQEAEIFCNYLLKTHANESVKERYSKLVEQPGGITAIKNRQVVFALKHPWSIGMLDGANALIDPRSELRRRLHLLFAILEATPEYSDHFLAKDRSIFYILVIAWTGIRAVLQTLCGLVLLKMLGVSS